MSRKGTAARAEEAQTLPAGWRWVRLGEVCELNPRRPALDRSDDRPTSFVPMTAVDEVRGVIAKPELKRFAEVKKGYTYFTEGDVLFAKITPCMQNGKHAIARDLIDHIGFGSTEFHVISPGVHVSSEWVHLYVRQRFVLDDATAHFTGAVGQQRVPDSYLASLEIPLPPLPEQKRIAAILNGQLAAVDNARAAAEAQLEAAKALPAAYLRRVFPKPGEKLPQGWRWVQLGEMSDLLPSKSIASDGDAEVQAITTACLTETGFSPLGIKPARMWSADAPLCVVAAGEVLIARSNTPDLVGRAAMFEGTQAEVVASDLTIRIRTNCRLEPGYLTSYLSSIFIKGYWKEASGGASGTMKKITRTQVAALSVPLPPLDEQRRITGQIAEKMTRARNAQAVFEDQLHDINALPAALLRRAFSGEL